MVKEQRLEKKGNETEEAKGNQKKQDCKKKKRGKWGGYRSKIKDKEKRSRRRVAEQNKKEEGKRRSRGRAGLANERSPYANDGTRVKT